MAAGYPAMRRRVSFAGSGAGLILQALAPASLRQPTSQP